MANKLNFDTPILLICFNRPSLTKNLIDLLRKVRPSTIYVAIDGPRSDVLEDRFLCGEVERVVQEIDWPSDVFTKVSTRNLGCGRGPVAAIDWVMSEQGSAIILEDDCVPDLSFFKFCAELLIRYGQDERVMMISGNDHRGIGPSESVESYTFSRYTQTFGWATWARAWKHFDFGIESWPTLKKDGGSKNFFSTIKDAVFWDRIFDDCYFGEEIDFWDYQWTYACLRNSGLCVIPSRNLVSNFGFGELGGTHFKRAVCKFSYLPTYGMEFPLNHPPSVYAHAPTDLAIGKFVHQIRNPWFTKLIDFARPIKRFATKVFVRDERKYD